MADNTERDAQKVPEFAGTDDDKAILRYSWGIRQEAFEAKRNRMFQNKINFDTFNLRGDMTHKKLGQSKEFLPKQMMATEQVCSFMHQAMIDAGQWFRIKLADGSKGAKVTGDDMTALVKRHFAKVKIEQLIEDGMKMGSLGALMIFKVHGRYVNKPKFFVEHHLEGDRAVPKLKKRDKLVWELVIDLIRAEDYFPDPTGDGLYEGQQIEMDLFQVKKLSQGEHAIYDPEIVDSINSGFEDAEQVALKARETGQNQTFHNTRKRVRVQEWYGTVLDPTTGEVLYENCMWTICNDVWLIQKPTPIPFWHGKSPIVNGPLVRGLAPTVWHKAMMDAPTLLNIAANEVFNLQLDSGLMATWGIRQLRTSWMSDETQVSEGFLPGDTIEVNELCPPGMKVLEPIQTTQMSPESQAIFNQVNQEFNMAAMTNDIRMGSMPKSDTKATTVVEASQTITSMFTGLAKIVELGALAELLEKSWMTIAQHINDLDDDEMVAVLGQERADALKAMSNEEMFASTANGTKFEVFGISKTLAKMKNFKSVTALLQTIGTSPTLIEEFIKKWSFSGLLEVVMDSLDLDTKKLELAPEEIAAMKGQQPGAPQNPANAQSQIPQMTGPQMGSPNGGPQPAQGGGPPQANFPPSRALEVSGR